jgi:Family of unknown function (DUF6101)
VASSAKSIETIRIESSDPRSDNRRRVIDVACGTVFIRRAVAGVAMTVRVPSSAYRGVALRIAALEDGRFHYEVKLAHSDPDLAVPLAEGHDQDAVEAEWRGWVRFLHLPALVGRAQGQDVEINTDATDIARRLPAARRRGRAPGARRPRFLARRKVGGAPLGVIAEDERAPLFGGSKPDR